MRKKMIYMAPLAIAALVLFIALGGQIVMMLWNWLLPPLFGWHAINFWQGLGLLALCRILFGRFGGHGFGRSGFRGRMGDRWRNMTPEERERFRQGMRDRCGMSTPASEGPRP